MTGGVYRHARILMVPLLENVDSGVCSRADAFCYEMANRQVSRVHRGGVHEVRLGPVSDAGDGDHHQDRRQRREALAIYAKLSGPVHVDEAGLQQRTVVIEFDSVEQGQGSARQRGVSGGVGHAGRQSRVQHSHPVEGKWAILP